MTAEANLSRLGITLPPAPQGVGAYVPWIRAGNLIYTSGQLPWLNGQLAFTGTLGGNLDEAQGFQAARLCAINAIAQLKEAAGDLENIQQIIRLDGFVHCHAGFRAHPIVLNGASELLNEIFGSRGRHTRVALGIHEMPLDAPVQISVIAMVQ